MKIRKIDPQRLLSPENRRTINQYRNHVWTMFRKHNGFLWSTSLTYTTLFALVPLLAVALSLFKAFGGFEEVQQSLLLPVISEFLDPTHKIRVMEYIQGYIDRINAGALGIIGTGVFIVAFVPLFQNMETAINTIWGKEEDRPIWFKFVMYWTITTLGPMAAVMMISTLSFFNKFIPDLAMIQSLRPMIMFYVFFGLFLIYKLVPNTEVKNKPALTGAAFGTVAWVIANFIYQTYMKYATTQFTIYGSLGAIPVFLLWVYINWIIILFGVEICKTAQYPEFANQTNGITPTKLMSAAIRLFRMLFDNTHKGVYQSELDISRSLNYPPEVISALIGPLKEAGMLTIKGGTLLPGRAPEDLTLYDIARVFMGDMDDNALESLSIETDRLREIRISELE